MVARSRLKRTGSSKRKVTRLKTIAKKVYSFDLGREIDRTEQPHPLGLFDTDFRDRKASNPQAREWTYGGSRKTIEAARKDAGKLQELSPSVETRIVKSDTGEVVEASKW